MLITWASYTVALWAVSQVLPGFRISGGLRGALGVATIFGLLNWALGWFLAGVIGVLTLGLGFLFSVVTHWIVTAGLLMVTDAFSERLKIQSMKTAALGALGVSGLGPAVEWLLHRVLN